MMPQEARVLRREQRHAWRGISGGRRTTHRVVTTYGRGQELAAHFERWRGITAVRRTAEAVALGIVIDEEQQQQEGAQR